MNKRTPYKVAVIGAGASGLAAVKCCLDEGLQPTCFEKSDGVGGLWRYTDTAVPGRAGVYRSTTINTSKELLAYSTFPPPANFPNFMHNSKLYQYMELYAEKYSLKKYIRLNTEVIKVEKDADFDERGSWLVTTATKSHIEDRDSECNRNVEGFDAVMVCTGHHAYPNNPASKIPGFKIYRGRIYHGHEYRDHKPFENRRVMVVGLGNTGGDIAAELSRHSKTLHLSTRRGAWVINRIAHRGLPYDCEVVTRLFHYLMNITPSYVLNWFYEKKMTDRFDHELYGLKPEHRILSQHPLVNDELPARIANGTVTLVPDVTSFREEGVVTSDGRFHEVDDVIFATGYSMKFPFLPDDVIKVDDENNLSPLYKHVFPLSSAKTPTIALIGNVQPLGGLMPIAEMQSRWAVRVFKGTTSLPSMKNMQLEVSARENELKQRYICSKRHTIQVDYIKYMDTIADEIKVKPDLPALLTTDPLLAWKVLTGPATSYQFRLNGPGSWPGAREAINQQWPRIHSGFGKSCRGKNASSSMVKTSMKRLSTAATYMGGVVAEEIAVVFAAKSLASSSQWFGWFFIVFLFMSATLIFALP